MPISKNWSRANRSHIEENAPTKSGIYELRSFGDLMYIGHASNIQRRLLEHLSERDPNYYRFKTAGWLSSSKKMEDEHLTRYEEKNGSLPPWNDNDTRAKR
ncbi:DUF7508 domain-containing protein [Natrinema thermotolerans]